MLNKTTTGVVVTIALALGFLSVVATACFMFANGRPVPGAFSALLALLVGVLVPSPATHVLNNTNADLSSLLTSLMAQGTAVVPASSTSTTPQADPFPGEPLVPAVDPVTQPTTVS